MKQEAGADSYLYPVFRQLCFHSQHLSGINIRVMCLIKGLFQLLQLVRGEYGPVGTGGQFKCGPVEQKCIFAARLK